MNQSPPHWARRGHYLGTEVGGKWWRRYRGRGFFARGNGSYWADSEAFRFLRYLTRKPLEIPFARVTAVEAVPDSQLKKATVDAGPHGPRTVVCGAPNCREGMTTVYVPAGVTLNGEPIRKAEIRGVVSDGMLAKLAVTTWPLKAALGLTASMRRRPSTTSVKTTLFRVAPMVGSGRVTV